jgi:hypothetical protein
MNAPSDSMLNELSGLEDDVDLSPEDLEVMAADDAAIEAETPKSGAEEHAELEEAEVEAAAKQPQPQVDEKQRGILADLVAERKRRQELERQVTELQIRAELEAKQKQAQEPPKAPEPPADPEPDYLDDPKAWTEWKVRQQESELKALRERLEKTSQGQEQSAQVQAISSALQRSETNFLSQNPDYYHALNHARQRVFQDTKAEAELLGVQVTDEQLIEHVLTQERQLAANLVTRGIDPAKYVYEIARRRYGYTPPNGAAGDQTPAPERPDYNPQARAASDEATRAALRGLRGGDTALQPQQDSGNFPSEIAAAFNERFGRR